MCVCWGPTGLHEGTKEVNSPRSEVPGKEQKQQQQQQPVIGLRTSEHSNCPFLSFPPLRHLTTDKPQLKTLQNAVLWATVV